MDLAQLANLGEFIGGVAVLMTLIYLALQARGSAQEQRIASMLAATRELAAVTQAITSTNERAEIWLHGLSEFDSLEPAQRLRFSAILGHYLRHIEQLFYQNRNNRVAPDVYDGCPTTPRFRGLPGVRGMVVNAQTLVRSGVPDVCRISPTRGQRAASLP